jgi:hypothetical protein
VSNGLFLQWSSRIDPPGGVDRRGRVASTRCRGVVSGGNAFSHEPMHLVNLTTAHTKRICEPKSNVLRSLSAFSRLAWDPVYLLELFGWITGTGNALSLAGSTMTVRQQPDVPPMIGLFPIFVARDESSVTWRDSLCTRIAVVVLRLYIVERKVIVP